MGYQGSRDPPPAPLPPGDRDRLIKLLGLLGSDFDGVTSLPDGIDSVADLPKITQALLERGYTREQIHKILGGNFLRVMHEVEAKAKELQAESMKH